MAKILVGMSGGVDSSVAAKLLLDQGHEVTGVTLKLFSDDDIARKTRAAPAARFPTYRMHGMSPTSSASSISCTTSGTSSWKK